MSLIKDKMITFGGNPEDMVWVFDASEERDLLRGVSVVAEPPYEIVHFKNGEAIAAYINKKITHEKTKNDIVKYYFVNIKKPCQTAWGTAQKLEYTDSQTQKIVSIGANGIIAFTISDSIKFIEKVAGNKINFTAENLIDEMLHRIMDDFNEHLLSVITENNISYAEMDGLLKEIAKRLTPKLNTSLEKYGVNVEEFIIKQFVKPQELKERTNIRAEKTMEYEDLQLDKDRKISLLEKDEKAELQVQKILKNRAEHDAGVDLIQAKANAEIERMGYEEAKGVSYKDIREMDREDVRVAAKGEADIRDATKLPEVTIINKSQDNIGKCPYCDGEISANHIFCPTCKKKII